MTPAPSRALPGLAFFQARPWSARAAQSGQAAAARTVDAVKVYGKGKKLLLSNRNGGLSVSVPPLSTVVYKLAGNVPLSHIAGLGIDADNFAAAVVITDLGADTLVSVGANTITLLGVDGADANGITADDFRFL